MNFLKLLKVRSENKFQTENQQLFFQLLSKVSINFQIGNTVHVAGTISTQICSKSFKTIFVWQNDIIT